ncbi:MAG TPA: phage tail protein [Anaerolineaceae bacterium]|nr:phage tail protein [Anaerolineaceae bacterium]
MPVLRNQPYGNSNFRVEIDGLTPSNYLEVVLPDLALEIAEYREGTDRSDLGQKLIVRPRIGNVILRRGFRGEKELYEWWKTNADGNLTRRNVSVVLQDESRKDVVRWNMNDAIPARLSYSPLDGLDGSPLIETLELTVENLVLE